MSWWNLPDSKTEFTGDTAADEASDLLAPLARMVPKPTIDAVLDALEVLLRDGAWVSDRPLGERTLYIRDRLRLHAPPQASLVDALRQGAPGLVTAYQDELERLPTLRELVYSISFVFAADPAEYTGYEGGDLNRIKISE